jgi:hypothetical protein
MQGFPESASQFEKDRRAAVSADSAKVFQAIQDNPVVKAVLVELRHTCYYGVADYGPGAEPLTFGGFEKFAEVKHDAEFIFDASGSFGRKTPPMSVRILDAMGALVWSKERDA